MVQIANISDIIGAAIILAVGGWMIIGIISGIRKQSIKETIEEIKEWVKNKPVEVKEKIKEIKILP